MGVSDRREREKEEMRKRILDSAKKLFLEFGFEKTSIRNIAEDIEYSPATIYLYFKDKNELLFELHQESFKEFAKAFVKVAEIEDPFERLTELGREYLAFAFGNPEMYELMFLLSAPIETLEMRDCVWEDGLNVFSSLEALVADCKAAGYFKDAEVSELSMMIWSTVHGLCTIYLRKRTNMFDESERLGKIEGGFRSFIEILKNYKL